MLLKAMTLVGSFNLAVGASLADLAFIGGTLYGMSSMGMALPSFLYTVNLATGHATQLAGPNLPSFGNALSSNQLGSLYWARLAPLASVRIYTVDPATGTATPGPLITPPAIRPMSAWKMDFPSGDLFSLLPLLTSNGPRELLVVNPVSGASSSRGIITFGSDALGGLDALVLIAPIARTLSITKTVVPLTTEVTPASNVTYNIQITNTSRVTASNVVLTDAIPANMVFVSFAAPAGAVSSTPTPGTRGTVSSTVASLGAGQSIVFILVVQVLPVTPIGITITNTALPVTTSSSVRTVSANTTISIVKTTFPLVRAVTAGCPVTYNITVTNTGSRNAAQKVIIRDAIPPNTQFVAFQASSAASTASTTKSPGPCEAAGVIVSTIPVLAPGVSVSFTLTLLVSPFAPGSSVIENVVTATASNAPTATSNASVLVLPRVCCCGQ